MGSIAHITAKSHTDTSQSSEYIHRLYSPAAIAAHFLFTTKNSAHKSMWFTTNRRKPVATMHMHQIDVLWMGLMLPSPYM